MEDGTLSGPFHLTAHTSTGRRQKHPPHPGPHDEHQNRRACKEAGQQVTDAQAGPDGTLEVWPVTDYPAAAACSDCQAVSARRHDTVLARPRDVRRAG